MSFGGSHENTQSKSTSTSTGTTTTSLAPEFSNLLYGNIDKVQGLASTPFQPYGGQQVAPFNGTQMQARDALTGMWASQTGDAPLNAAIGIAGQVGGYQPQTVGYQPLTGVNLGEYMSPYTQSVIDQSVADIDRQQKIQDQQAASQATQAGAFGGSRSAVLQGLTDDSFARTKAQTIANLNQANFSQAQAAAQADLQRQAAAQQSNQGAGLQAAGLNLNAANALAGFGGQQLSQAMARAGALQSVGDVEQKNQQAQLDAAYQQWQLAQQYPLQMQALLNQTIGMVPQYGTSATSGQQSGTGSGSSTGLSFHAGVATEHSPFSFLTGG
jgi:hypothetical protein